jgi:hypothetical protein
MEPRLPYALGSEEGEALWFFGGLAVFKVSSCDRRSEESTTRTTSVSGFCSNSGN